MSAATKTTKSPAKKAGTKTAALAVKRKLRSSTPKFQRHANYRKVRLDKRWKKPRGLHNKQRDNKRGSSPRPSDGYRTPPSVRGLHISGLEMVHVSQVAQLASINKETQAVVVASVGGKRQREILEACMKAGLRVLNHKPEARIKLLDSRRSAKQAKLAAARKSKEESEKQKSAKSAKKEKADAELSDEEKKEQQDKLKEEVLTSKNAA